MGKKQYFNHLFSFCSLSFYVASSQQKNNSKKGLEPTEIWESGLPNIENFTPDDYESNPQNWSILEGNGGFIYFGNTSGVIQFDGSSWNTIQLENKNLIRSLAKKNDKVFFGGINELGYL